MKISAVLIAKNEEVMISRCLDSLRGLDEIIVCDTGSEDQTVEIAKRYTSQVYTDFLWRDHFAKARNHAKGKAHGDWILSIDCDEFLHNVAAVRADVVEAEKRGVWAVDIDLISDDDFKQHHWFPRLFKNSPQVWWNGAVHNHLSVIGGLTGQTKITYGYSPAHDKDRERTLRILEKEVKTRPDAVREMFYLGREYFYRSQFTDCLTVLGKYVQKSVYLAEKADAFLIMARAYWNLRMADDARDACVQALIINSHFKEAVLFMAELMGDGSGNEAWQHNANQWKNMAKTADNSNVLFKRDV